MNRFIFPFLFCLLFTSFFFACNDDYDTFSSNPGDVLSFSHDTLSFDTVFSTVGSATKKIMVYNHNKKALNISRITLQGASNSGFRINVDGFRGSDFQDIAIQGKDSIYILVETTVGENGKTAPILALDSIVFITNTVRQQVILQAYGQDAHIHRQGLVIENDSALTSEKPFLIYDSLVVRPNATLTIKEGTTLYLHDKAKIEIYGTLNIIGSQEKPVTIRGDRMDQLLGIPYDKQAGQWHGMRFHAESTGNIIEHARIRNGIYGLTCDSSDVAQSKLKISHSVLSNVHYNLLEAENCQIEVDNCELSNAGGALVSLRGGDYSFTHCTLANYFVWSSRKGASVQLSNYKTVKEGDTPLPLLKADFLNCIVYGSYTSEIAINKSKDETLANTDFLYRFDYCLIKMDYKDLNTDRVTNYILNKNPEFHTVDNSDYVYNYRLQSTSPAIHAGSSSYPADTDLDGIARPQGEAPDMGAYEWIATD